MSREPDLDESQFPLHYPSVEHMGCYSCVFCGARDDLSCGCAELQQPRTSCQQVKCDECERLRGLTLGPFISQTTFEDEYGNERPRIAVYATDVAQVYGNCKCGSTCVIEVPLLNAEVLQ